MSLRDFNTPASDDPIALHNEPLGNGAGLSDFHTVNVEEGERSNTPKIVGAVAVALMVGAAAVGLYAYSGPSTKSVVADNTLPKTAPVTPPPQQTAMAPDNSMTPAPDKAASAAPITPAPAPEPAATKPEPAKPAPVHTASRSSHHIKSASSSEPASDAASVRMSADTTQATQAPQQAQVTPAQPAPQQAQATPLPAAPTPSPSDVASNGGQSSAAVPNNATTASDIPQAAPAPAQPQAPAQNAQPAPAPAPAQ